jgi:hypothetical protein
MGKMRSGCRHAGRSGVPLTAGGILSLTLDRFRELRVAKRAPVLRFPAEPPCSLEPFVAAADGPELARNFGLVPAARPVRIDTAVRPADGMSTNPAV